MADYKELASTLIDLIGGKQNITNAWHCVTRLRFNLVDDDKVRIDDIKQTKGVMGAQFSGEQFQIIIGNDVESVFEEVDKQLGHLLGGEGERSEKKGIISGLMDVISGIFTPALPALIGTGLLKGVIALLEAFNWIQVDGSAYQILIMISDCAFYFLPFILAVSSARKFKTNEYLALCIAGVLMYPTMMEGFEAVSAGQAAQDLSLFGVLPIPYLNYSSSVIPIILATYLLKFVYDFVKKWMPKTISIMFTPMVTLLIVIPITLVVLGPIGTYIGQGLAVGVTWLFDHIGFLAAAFIGAFYPILVMTGMHWAMSPIMINNFSQYGFDNSMMPAMLAATFAIAGATFGVFFKTKNENMKQISLSSGISAVVGVTEPAMYGVTLKLKKPFYAAMIGGGIAGAFINLTNVASFGMAMPGLTAIPGYIDSTNGSNIIFAIIASLLAFVVAFVVAWVLGFEEETADTKEERNKTGNQLSIEAPVAGKIQPIETVSDVTFAEQIMGYTVAIIPDSDQITSPIAGEVVMIAETKHAIGLRSNDGLEILLHLGIDTVELKGDGFTPKVQTGDQIKVGDLLMDMDVAAIKEAGYDPVVLTIVTNSNDYLKILPVYKEDDIASGAELSVAVN
ncbi:beta-glucoside-specific PTS transporter subunit IIABC [Tetragenococcus koreensis]|uniref:beta-glucoside-specific PTS transporter subunit IIABC n=1 Tax=Tetragenococcus koreensis TaxID=290335 RepID=UPI000F511359|nr:beta-glucoside-specific PTS transporter subunit IIABC [Tetragenococcus koreensis]AYW45972.1 PTS beta-glucoside transporter subunit EIIBCA [Tetragenococcus koreensis]GEN90852.1 PTS beta-glucoside transporter subunit EIIBCA [Tetragenococcus koreensis]